MKTGKILIVEGDLTFSKVLQTQLRDAGYVVDAQQTGQKALEELKREWVDLLIVSSNLQGEMDGFGFIKAVKKNKGLSKIPILMTSNKPGIKKVVEKLGVEDFFEKPSKVDVLKKRAEEILEKKGQVNVDRM
ncbi:MAG: response regulator [Candidatus Omnitrophica bacterium]|nr:response regulator [Candidatus Omnitrophota bacterium]